MSKIRMIKADAVVDLKVGTPFINRLQQALVYMVSQFTDEQSETFNKMIGDNKSDFQDPLLDHAFTLLMLVRDLEKSVVDGGHYTDKDAEVIQDDN